MVKGLSRQVIVVKSPDGRMFEQAIFILRADALGQGADEESIIAQARAAADGYVRGAGGAGRGRGWRIPKPAWAAAGGALVGLAWALSLLL